MSVPRRISLITLGVDDVPRAKAFYEALGWSCSSASVEGEVAFLPTADSVLALWGRQALADEVGVPAARASATWPWPSTSTRKRTSPECWTRPWAPVAGWGRRRREPTGAASPATSPTPTAT